MEKLIELLNEYSKNIWYFNEEDLQRQTKAWILSKKFWFIKWLVENDKIDLDTQAMQYAKSDLSKFFTEWKDKGWMSDDYAMLLMLSIQDEPINFLLWYWSNQTFILFN